MAFSPSSVQFQLFAREVVSSTHATCELHGVSNLRCLDSVYDHQMERFEIKHDFDTSPLLSCFDDCGWKSMYCQEVCGLKIVVNKL